MTNPFQSNSRTFGGTLCVWTDPDAAFALFTPLGEKRWIEGWDPEIVYPPGAEIVEGMIWRTRSGDEEHVWLVARFDPTAREVSYFRVEPGRLVARIDVRCRALADRRTEVTVFYMFTALSEAANDAIRAMTEEEYATKLRRWEESIRLIHR